MKVTLIAHTGVKFSELDEGQTFALPNEKHSVLMKMDPLRSLRSKNIYNCVYLENGSPKTVLEDQHVIVVYGGFVEVL